MDVVTLQFEAVKLDNANKLQLPNKADNDGLPPTPRLATAEQFSPRSSIPADQRKVIEVQCVLSARCTDPAGHLT